MKIRVKVYLNVSISESTFWRMAVASSFGMNSTSVAGKVSGKEEEGRLHGSTSISSSSLE